MGQTPSSHRISARDRAILDLKTQRDRLMQHQRRLAHLSDGLTATAAAALSASPPDRARARHALRVRREHANLLDRTYDQLAALESLVGQVEFAAVQVAVVEGLRQGTAVLKQLNGLVGGVEGVEQVMDDHARERDRAEEIGEVLAGEGVGSLSSEDQVGIERELEEMETQAQAQETVRAKKTTTQPQQQGRLPAVPTQPLEHGTQDQLVASSAGPERVALHA